ncbi:LacI family DNA-binding transcriptional regulator [Kaistia terrae]|uniref:LacI family DNA-binding transcriptional regulator n=1 Tax=Kaistia terrae TaxID=537017 RepID=A0ABW0PRR2_9HYPH|nr:LacI family DNA-binding transcriptional regulator [Kaistia terrae]MCX5577963.1 LacI family DNA-binding transcriptional regulator [Kaistia terrae]
MMAKPNLHTVAAHAGVSIATVSKVVNGVRYGISEATLEKVLASVRELGYRPNRSGRGLRTLRRSIIGMAIVDPSPTFLADPFTTNLVAGLSNYLSEQGFGLLLHGIKPRQVEASFLVRESVVDGLCLLLSGSAQFRLQNTRLFSALSHPMVVFQDRAADGIPDTCFVNQDDTGGARELAERALTRKPRTALIVIPDIFWPAIELRLEAFWQTLKAAGVATKIVRCDESDPVAIARAIGDSIERSGMPDVILGANDKIAIVALHLLKERGVQVPEEVAVTGFNAFASNAYAGLDLTTARSPAYEMGELGGKLLLERLESGAFESRERTLPVQLIPGATA